MSVLLCLVGLHSLQLGGQATVEGMELLEFAAGENQEDVILHVILVLSYFYTVYIQCNSTCSFNLFERPYINISSIAPITLILKAYNEFVN